MEATLKLLACVYFISNSMYVIWACIRDYRQVNRDHIQERWVKNWQEAVAMFKKDSEALEKRFAEYVVELNETLQSRFSNDAAHITQYMEMVLVS